MFVLYIIYNCACVFGELFAAVCVLAAAAAACPSHELESDQKTYEGGGGVGLDHTCHILYITPVASLYKPVGM